VPWQNSPVPRLQLLVLGALGYLLAIVPMVLFVGFLGDFVLPRTIDRGPGAGGPSALAIDLALLVSFAFVHSALARPAVKQGMARWVPPPLERSLYSAIAGLQILTLLYAWRPLPGEVWSLGTPALRLLVWGLFWSGWGIVVAALAAVDSAHLFGLRQSWSSANGRACPSPPLAARGPYRWIRHPLYSGTVLALFAAPEMSRGHLLLATFFTLYIAIGATYEDRELEARFGESFLAYRRAVPAYLPRIRRRRSPEAG